jgi:hypothetical protein
MQEGHLVGNLTDEELLNAASRPPEDELGEAGGAACGGSGARKARLVRNARGCVMATGSYENTLGLDDSVHTANRVYVARATSRDAHLQITRRDHVRL